MRYSRFSSFIAAILLAAAASAFAVDFGISTGYDKTAKQSTQYYTVGETIKSPVLIDNLNIQAGVQTVRNDYSLVDATVGAQLFTFDKFSFGVRGGLAYMLPTNGANNWGYVFGGGVSYALTKDAALTVDYRHLEAGTKSNTTGRSFDGNSALVGLKVSF